MGWETNKVALNAKMGLVRMNQHRQKLEYAISGAEADIVAELRRNAPDAALRKMESVVAQRRDLQLMDVVQSAYRQLTQNLALVAASRRACPPELAVALGVVVWSADRMQVQEFGVVRDHVFAKFNLPRNALARLPGGGAGPGESAHLAGITVPAQIVEAFGPAAGSDRAALVQDLAELARRAGVPFVPPPVRQVTAEAPSPFPPAPQQPQQPPPQQQQQQQQQQPTTVVTAATPEQRRLAASVDVPAASAAVANSSSQRRLAASDAALAPPQHSVASSHSPRSSGATPSPTTSAAGRTPSPVGSMAPMRTTSPPSAAQHQQQQQQQRQRGGGGFHLTAKSSFVNLLSKLTEKTASPEEVTEAINGARDAEPKDMPLRLDPHTLTFGLGSRQAPVDEELVETLTLSNLTRDRLCFAFSHAPDSAVDDRCTITFDPPGGQVHGGKTAQVVARLKVAYTTKFETDVVFCVWSPSNPRESGLRATLHMAIESQLSCKLDWNELKVGDMIGEGAFGTVSTGEYRGLPVAIKLLKHQEDVTPELLGDFKAEVAMLEKLRHPAIINFIGAVHTKGRLSIVTEFCVFGNLFSAMKKHPFSTELKLKCLVDCASGVDFLHQSGIIHRDLKPDNLLMVSLEPRSSVVAKLSDFGTTRDVSTYSAGMSSTKGVGTPLFMSPEVLDGESYERPSDVYSFALIISIVFSGVLPFSDEKFASRPWEFAAAVRAGKRPKIPEGIVPACQELMVQCWAPNKDERPNFATIHKRLVEIQTTFQQS